MKKKFKILHLLALMLLLIVLVRYRFIYDIILLQIFLIKLAFSNPDIAFNQLSINLLDYFASLFIIVSVPVVLFLKRDKLNFLQAEAGLTNSILTGLIIFTFLAPVIAPAQYDMQYNISVSKLLSPLNTKYIVMFKKNADAEDPVQGFIIQRDIVFNRGLTGRYLVADSIKTNWDLTICQKEKKQVISRNEIQNQNISIEISKICFLFGTDEYGRDIFSRLIYGTRLSLLIGLGSVAISFFVGLIFGFTAGYFGGIFDTLLNRLADIFLSFPIMFLVILIVGLFGNSVITVVTVLGLAGWMSLFKIVRNETAGLKQKDFIITSKLLGFSHYNILFKEMLPIMMPSIVVTLVLQYGSVIIAESALSYLGFGLGNNFPSWGAMIEAGQYYLSKAWWVSFFPCLFLFLTLYTANHWGGKLDEIFRIRYK